MGKGVERGGREKKGGKERSGGGCGGRKNNFLERPPNPSPGISDIPSANMLIRGETSLFHGAIFHAITNQPSSADSGEGRPSRGSSGREQESGDEGCSGGWGRVLGWEKGTAGGERWGRVDRKGAEQK